MRCAAVSALILSLAACGGGGEPDSGDAGAIDSAAIQNAAAMTLRQARCVDDVG